MMECPHCGYLEEIIVDTAFKAEKKVVEGGHGKFFEPMGNASQLERLAPDKRIQIASVAGCPRCKKMFIEVD